MVEGEDGAEHGENEHEPAHVHEHSEAGPVRRWLVEAIASSIGRAQPLVSRTLTMSCSSRLGT